MAQVVVAVTAEILVQENKVWFIYALQYKKV
jgi:hypothetical protein